MADEFDLDDLLNETLNEMEELEKKKDEDTLVEPAPAPVGHDESAAKITEDSTVGDSAMSEFMEGITALMKEVSGEGGAGLPPSGEGNPLEALHEAMKNNLEESAESEPFPEDFSKAFGQFMENMGEDGDFLQSAMKNLLAKDVLHEPMVALRDKYPSWLEANKDSISGEDYSRYTKQYEHICRICDIYESSPDSFDELMEVMQKMEESGQPPQSLLSDLGYDEAGPFGGMGGMPGIGGMPGMEGIPEGGIPGMEELLSSMGGMGGEMPDMAGMEEFARQLMAGLNLNGEDAKEL